MVIVEEEKWWAYYSILTNGIYIMIIVVSIEPKHYTKIWCDWSWMSIYRVMEKFICIGG